MAVGRESFDLFIIWKHSKQYGHISFKERFLRGLKNHRKLMFYDTFGRFGCYFLGHRTYVNDVENGKELIACNRCNKFID